MRWSGATSGYSYDPDQMSSSSQTRSPAPSNCQQYAWGSPWIGPSSCWSDITGNGGTGQLSGHWTTLVTIGVALSGSSGDATPPLSHAVTSARAASATAMSSTLILDVKRAPLPTGRPKLLGARFRPRSVLGQPAGRGGDVVDAGQVGILQRNVVGHRRNEGAGDP